MAKHGARSLKQTVTNGSGFRDRAIAEYHELLAADETLTPATFEKLRSAMRKNRLLYGERPIGIALRPHSSSITNNFAAAEPRGRTRYKCVGKGCSRSRARSEPDG